MQMNFSHVAFVDLEMFGIYNPPPQVLRPTLQALGLSALAQPSLCDFEIICEDGGVLGCSRRILEERWPWFKRQIEGYHDPRSQLASENGAARSEEVPPSDIYFAVSYRPNSFPKSPPRHLTLPYPSNVVQALLEYLYTLSLTTPNQLSLPVLQQLLLFSTLDETLPRLRALVVHALHEALREDCAVASKIHASATLAGCLALQIRCLKIMKAVRSTFSFSYVELIWQRAGNERTRGSISPLIAELWSTPAFSCVLICSASTRLTPWFLNDYSS